MQINRLLNPLQSIIFFKIKFKELYHFRKKMRIINNAPKIFSSL